MPVKRSQLFETLINVPKVGRYARRLHDPVLNLKYLIYREYLKNPQSRKQFVEHLPVLSEVQSRIVKELDRFGVSKVDCREGLGMKTKWQRLRDYANEFARSDAVREKAEAFKSDTEPVHGKDHKSLVRHFVEDQVIRWDNPVLQMGIDTRILDVVNSYLGMWAKLKKIHLWYNIPSDVERTRTGPQNWHRDPEDQKMVTVFLYLTDVDADSGPLQYIPETRFKGRYHSKWPRYGRGNRDQ